MRFRNVNINPIDVMIVEVDMPGISIIQQIAQFKKKIRSNRYKQCKIGCFIGRYLFGND